MGTLSLEHLQPMVCLAFGTACSTKKKKKALSTTTITIAIAIALLTLLKTS